MNSVLNLNNPLARHSRAGGNPARTNIPQSGQNHDVVPLRGKFFNHLDSRLRGNDAVFANGLSGIHCPGKQSGLSMIEVLVTLLILMVGLLGLAGLQTQGLRSEMESYQRVQALILLQDMVGRINANRGNNSLPTVCAGLTDTALYACQWGNVSANVNAYVADNVGIVTDGQPYVCTALSGEPRDRCEWSNALKGAAETNVGASVGAMIGGRGCVTLVSSDANQISLQVHVAWQGLGKTLAPTTSACGKDQYGDDAQRRVVSLTLRIANLSAT